MNNVEHYYPQFYSQRDEVESRPRNRGARIFNDELETFLDETHKIAQQVLRPEEQDGYQPHCRHIGRVGCNSYVFAPMIFTGPTYNVGYSPRWRNDEPSGALRLFAGILGAIFGGYAIFKIGQAISTKREAGKELDDIHDFKRRIDDWKTDWRMLTRDRIGNHPVLAKVEKIAEARKSIFSRIRRKSYVDIALLTGFIAAAVFAVIGAIVASYPMLCIALGVGLGTGAAMLLKWGLDSSAKGHVDDAKTIERNVRELWAIRERQRSDVLAANAAHWD